jgi:iron complex outermembrane receptor protein
VDIFAAYLTDYISSVINPDLDPVIPSSPWVRQFINIDDAFKTGFELSWTQDLFAGLQQQLSVAYTYGQDLERDEPLPEIAPLDLRYQLTGTYLDNRLRPQLVLRHAAKQSRTSNEFGETATPAFTLLDVRVEYALSNQLSVNLGVNNLFDEAYFEHLNRSVRGTMDPIFAPGRNVFANLNFSF